MQCTASGNVGCYGNACQPATGKCAIGPVDAACTDSNACTRDDCSGAAGTCQNTAVASCGLTPPCTPATTPGCTDAALDDCVCGFDAYCCTTSWDAACVGTASWACGATCP